MRKLRLEVLHERLETLQDRLRQAETRTVNREPIVAATTTTAAANIPTEVIPPGSTSTAGEDENDYVVFPDGEALDHSLFEESEDEIDIETKSGEHEEAVFNESAGVKAGSLSSAQLSHAVEQIELMKRFIEIRREPSAAARAELTEALRPLERRVMMNESDQNLRFQMNHIRDVSPDRSIPVSDNSVDIDELVEQELIQNMESAWRDCGSDVSLDSDSGSDSSSNSDDEEYLKRSEAKSIKKLKKGLVNKWHASLMEEYDRSMEGVAVSQSESEQSMNMLSMLGDLIDRELVDDKNKDESKDEGNVEEMKIDSMLDAAVSNEETHSNISNYDQINSESIIESSEINETIVDVAVEPRPAVNDPFPVGIRRRRISHRFPQPNRAIENAQIGATNVNPLVLRPDGLNQIDAVQHEGNLVPAADNIAPVMNNQPEGERNDGFFSDLTSWFFLVVAYVIVFQITYDALPVLLGRAVLTVLQMRGSLTAFMSDVAKVAHFNAGNLTKLIVTSALYLSGDLSTGDNSSIPDIDFPSSSSASGIYNSDIVPSSSSSILSDIFSNPALELQHGTWLLDQLDLLVNNDTNIQDESILLVYVESLVGFCVIAFIVVLALICYFFFYVRSASAMKRYIYTQFAMASQYTSITIKGAGLAYIELGLTPKLIGFLLSIATIKVFQTTFEDRFDICYDLPILCGCVVWAVGVMLMFHFSIVLMSLHSLLREEVIYGVIPGARDYDAMIETVIGFYDNKSIWEHMKRIFISISLNLFLFVCIVFIPLHFGHILFPLSGLNPLKFRVASKSSGTELERSVELLVSHMLLPFLIERSQGDALDTLFRAILGVGGRMFKVGYLLNPHAFPFARVVPPQDTNNILHVRVLQLNAAVDNEIATADTNSIDAGVATDLSPDQQPQVTAANSTLTATASSDSSSIPIMMSQPIRQRAIIDMEKFSIEFRTCAFVLTVLICLSIAYSATLHITLMTGRFLVSFIDAKADHDANNLCVGVAACCGLIYACSFIARDFRSIELWNSIKTVFNKWGRIAVKLSIVSIFGLSLPPLLVGILNEAILLNPLTVAHDETPSFPLFRSWALGVIILKGWIK